MIVREVRLAEVRKDFLHGQPVNVKVFDWFDAETGERLGPATGRDEWKAAPFTLDWRDNCKRKIKMGGF